VILISAGLDLLFARIMPIRSVYLAIRMPGIALHEVAHVIGCIATGAKIQKVVLFSKKGGSVTYLDPELPLFGHVVISTAPLFVLPLTLAGLTWLFATYLGCSFPVIVPPLAGSVAGIRNMLQMVAGIFAGNLVVQFNGWFILYLYLTAGITLSLAPSSQDLTNAALGIAALISLCLLVIWSGFAPAIATLAWLTTLMAPAFYLGILYEMIAALVLVPFLILFLFRTI
jgi:hypothetical protein